MELIVNADDLGYSAHRDRGIFQAFREGIVTSASLIVNGASCQEAAKEALACGLEMGLHLNLTEGVPLTSVPSLIGEDGMMYYKMRFWKNEFNERDVQQETIAQLEQFKELTGSYPVHVDGHQHVQVAPNIPKIIAPILQQYGVRSIRIPDQDLDQLPWIDAAVRARYEMKYIYAIKARLVFLKHGIKAPNSVGVGLGGVNMSPALIKESLKDSYGTVELIVHPGHIGSLSENAGCGIVDAFDIDEGRKHECTVLCSIDLERTFTTWNNAF